MFVNSIKKLIILKYGEHMYYNFIVQKPKDSLNTVNIKYFAYSESAMS